MKRMSLLICVVVLLPGALLAQATPAPATSPQSAPKPAAAASTGKVGIVDFNRVVTENAEGKKALATFNKEVTDKQGEFQKVQQQISDMETELRTKDKLLSEEAKADIAKKIDLANTNLNRQNEDAQKWVADRQNQLFSPVAQRAKTVLDAYGAEFGYTVIFDTSSQASNIIYADNLADLTAEIIRRVDSEAAKAPAAPTAPAK